MSFPLFSLGFAPLSLTFPSSNVVKAIAIASLAALSVKMLLNTVAPSQAGHDHKHHRIDDKVCQESLATSTDDVNANNLTQSAQGAKQSRRIESATPMDHTITTSINNDKASHTTELIVAPKDVDLTKDVEIADDNTVIQGADSTEIGTDTKKACPAELNNAPEIVTSTHATPIVNDEKPAINSSNGVRSYRHSFPAVNIIEVVEVPSKQATTRSYYHSFPAVDIIEVVEAPSKQATVIASPIQSNNNTAALVNEQESTVSSDAAPKAEEAILNHTRKDSTALVTPKQSLFYSSEILIHHRTNFSTESQQTANSDLSATTPDTPDTLYSVPDIDFIDQLTPSGAKASEEDENHEENALTATAAANTTSRDNTRSKWYDFSHLSVEEMANLDTIIIIERPDTGISYTQLTCGFCYRLDEEENPLMMSQSEYEDLLAWFDSFKTKEEEIKLPPPVVLVTDEEGNERLAEEDNETSFVDQPDDCDSRAEKTIAIVD